MQFFNEIENVYFVFCSYVGQCMQCRVIHRVHQTLYLGLTKKKELHENKLFFWCTSFLIYMKQKQTKKMTK